MKFVIPTQELNFLINKIQNVVPQKPLAPILSNILFEVSNGVLTLTATDLTVGIQCQTEVKVIEEGSCALPAKRLVPLARELTAPNLQMTSGENDVTEIVAGTSRFKVHGMRGKEFPKLPDIESALSFQVEESVLKNLLSKVSFAVSKEEARLVLTGVLMRIANGAMTLMGTDGKRLARAHTPIQADQALAGSFVLPVKAIDELLKNLADTGVATVYLKDDKIGFKTGSTLLVTKLLTGEYPDVSHVIPEKSDAVFSIHREELMGLLRQVSLFVKDQHHSVRFSFSEGELALSANTSEIGEGKVSMPVNYRGPKTDIAFNPGFFLDVLRHSKEETLTMGITDSFNPGVISEKEESLSNIYSASPLFVVMPMRLSGE